MQIAVNVKTKCCNKLQVWSEGGYIHLRHQDVIDKMDIEHWKIVQEPEQMNIVVEAWIWEAHRIYENKNGANIKGN